MSTIDLEYAIKKDIRNNPVIRGVDQEQKREFTRMIWLAAVIVAMALFSAWQHFEIVNTGYKIERLRVERATEESLNRKLRLELETLRAPQGVESYALHKLRMVPPSSENTVVIERTTGAVPSRSIVAAHR
jgi:cell division protein FtsL